MRSALAVLLVAGAAGATQYGHRGQYAGHAVQYVDRTIYAVPVSPYYYTVGDGYGPVERERRLADEIMRRFRKEFEVAADRPEPPKTGGLGGTSPAEPRDDSREMFKLAGGTPDRGQDARVLEIIESHCVKCHKPGQARPGTQLLDSERALFAGADRRRIYESVADGSMPKGAGPLSAEEKSVLRAWADAQKE